jgi:hypothetical protein
VFQSNAAFLRIRAARKLFETALAATYHLRGIKAKDVKVNNVGAGSFLALAPTKEFPDVPSPQRLATSKCASAGIADINTKLGKAKKESKARNPNAANAATDAAKAFAGALAAIPADKRNEGIADVFSGELETTTMTIFKELFAMQFLHDGIFVRQEVDRFVRETFGEDAIAPRPAKAAKETKAA